MPKQCKACKKLIYILQINDGSWKAFEDSSGTVHHKCAEYVNLVSKTSSNDHVLLTETITRVSQIEHELEQIKEVMDKNGLHVQWRQ